MSDKAPRTVEEVEGGLACRGSSKYADGDAHMAALHTIKAACERLASMPCPTCLERRVEAARLGYMAGHDDTVESRYGDPLEVAQDLCQDLDDEAAICPNCKGTRKAFKDWQGALRSLEDPP